MTSARLVGTGNGLAISASSGPAKAGCTWPSSSICILVDLSAGPFPIVLSETLRSVPWKMAINLRTPLPDSIRHTDRGSQYCSHDYQKTLRQNKFKVSKSSKGNCCDNAAVEMFFKTIKAELIWRHHWPTRRADQLVIFPYINGFYNARRKHLALGWKSPSAFEAEAACISNRSGTKA